MFRPYVRVLRAPDVARPFFCSFLGSLPIGMLTLGVLLLIQSTTDSFARAGIASGALSLGNAIGLVIQGRLIDRRGQSVVLVVSGILCGASLVLLTVAATEHWPFPFAVAFAALAGTSIPAVNTSMRVLLPELLPSQDVRTTAYALLGTQFQLATITGPLVVSGLLLVAGPSYAVLTAAVLATGAGLVFAATPASRNWRPIPVSGDESGPKPHLGPRAILTPGLRTLLLANFGGGLAVGLASVAVPAVAVAHGAASLAGLLFAAQSAGDLVGGVVYGSRGWRLPRQLRLVGCQLVAMTGSGLLALVTGSPAAMLPLMFVIGIFHSPGGIVSSELLDVVARKRALGQSYTSMIASMLLGLASGSSIGGALGDLAAEWVLFASAAGIMAAVASWTFWRRRTLTAAQSVPSRTA